jgi:hypothetical protein
LIILAINTAVECGASQRGVMSFSWANTIFYCTLTEQHFDIFLGQMLEHAAIRRDQIRYELFFTLL